MLLSTAQLSLLYLGSVCVQLLLGFSVDCPVYQSLRANILQTPQYKNLSEVYKVVRVCVYVCMSICIVYTVASCVQACACTYSTCVCFCVHILYICLHQILL